MNDVHEKRSFLKRALDTTNAFMYNGNTLTVNPTIWDYKLREYEEANLVMTNICEKFDFRGAGVDYRVTVDIAPSAASQLTETTDISISALPLEEKLSPSIAILTSSPLLSIMSQTPFHKVRTTSRK